MSVRETETRWCLRTQLLDPLHGQILPIRFAAKLSVLNGEIRFGVPRLRGGDRLKAELRTLLAAKQSAFARDATWTPAWKHADEVRSDSKAFVTLNAENAPVILIASQASDYAAIFDSFKTAVKARPIHYADGVLRFETITFFGPAKPGEVGGKPVNLAPSRGYDSPFIRSDWNSGLIHIRKGDETVTLDFRDPQNPIKTVGARATSDFPPGVGNAEPAFR